MPTDNIISDLEEISLFFARLYLESVEGGARWKTFDRYIKTLDEARALLVRCLYSEEDDLK